MENQIIHMDPIRRAISYKTSSSWQEIPHVSFIYEADITEYINDFQKKKADMAQKGIKLSWNTSLIYVIVQGLKAAPRLNAYCNFDRKTLEGMIAIQKNINVGIPWILPSGKMITVTAQRMQEKSLEQMAIQLNQLREKVEQTDFEQLIRQMTMQKEETKLELSPKIGCSYADMIKATVTISNIGSICKCKGSVALLQIIPPQVLAVGIAAIQEKPGICISGIGKKEIGIRKILPITFVFDHRALDFGDLVPCLERIEKFLTAAVVL